MTRRGLKISRGFEFYNIFTTRYITVRKLYNTEVLKTGACPLCINSVSNQRARNPSTSGSANRRARTQGTR